MDERSLAGLAAELGMPIEELRAQQAEISPGIAEAVVGGLIRFEDALFELSQ